MCTSENIDEVVIDFLTAQQIDAALDNAGSPSSFTLTFESLLGRHLDDSRSCVAAMPKTSCTYRDAGFGRAGRAVRNR